MPSCMEIDEGNGNLCRMLHHFILLPESISGRVAHIDVRLKFPLDAPGDKDCIRCHGHTSLVNLCNKIVYLEALTVDWSLTTVLKPMPMRG